MSLDIIKKILKLPDIKPPEYTKFGRYLIYGSLIMGVIGGVSYLVLEADFSKIFPEEPHLILVEDYTNKPEWAVTPAILDPQYFGDENETISYFLSPVPLLISVKNQDKKSVEDTRLELEYPPIIQVISIDEANENKLKSKKVLIGANKSIKKIYELGTINPGESRKINDEDYLLFANTLYRSFNVTTKDNVPLLVGIAMTVGYPLNYTIYTKDNRPKHGKFTIVVGTRSYFINNTIPFTEVYFEKNGTIGIKYYSYSEK